MAENSYDELSEDLEVDWVKLYQILQAEHTALLSNRRCNSYILQIRDDSRGWGVALLG